MEYAGFWRRFGALCVDALILLIPTIVGHMILPVIGGFILGFLYRPFFEASEIMATPGKLFFGMQVTNLQGGRLTFGQAATRFLLSIVSSCFLGLGYMMNLFTPKRQTFHDVMVGSVVVRTNLSPDVDWFEIWRREFWRVCTLHAPIFDAANEPRVERPVEEAAPRTGIAAMAELEQLHRLFVQGALTEAEYSAKKAEILSRV